MGVAPMSGVGDGIPLIDCRAGRLFASWRASWQCSTASSSPGYVFLRPLVQALDQFVFFDRNLSIASLGLGKLGMVAR